MRNLIIFSLELSIALMIGVPPFSDCASNNAPLFNKISAISCCPA